MKTGIEFITEERLEQFSKHNRTIKADVRENSDLQLSVAARQLCMPFVKDAIDSLPKGWNLDIWKRMVAKPYKERLIIAGALIAAEIDRIQNN